VIVVPSVVRSKAIAAGGASWLDGLPDLVTRLCARWDLRAGDVFADATEALVLAVERSDATSAVLKVPVPQGDVSHEEAVLRLAGGDGCARLYDADPASGALLMERLGPSLHDLDVPVDRRHRLLVGAARRLWRPAVGSGLPSGADKASWLVGYIEQAWEEGGRPCSRRAVDHALACARRRRAGHDERRAVLVHGDVHQRNALVATPGGDVERDGVKLVDPDGMLAEPECDLGVLMREDPGELAVDADPRHRAQRLAAMTGLDAAAIWEWGVVERVSTGLLGRSVGMQPVADEMLHLADRIAVGWPD
jgi:streptomycin 6-kinase